MKTDEKDRPSVPVVIINCGELELRRPPPKRDATRTSYTSLIFVQYQTDIACQLQPKVSPAKIVMTKEEGVNGGRSIAIRRRYLPLVHGAGRYAKAILTTLSGRKRIPSTGSIRTRRSLESPSTGRSRGRLPSRKKL